MFPLHPRPGPGDENPHERPSVTDTLTPEQRSKLMSRIRSQGTTPEMAIRRLVHGMGYRYRLHRRNLPGTPDLVFGPRRKVIFVHGCFWHRHEGCNLARMPKSRLEFWRPKLEGNRARDERNQQELKRLNWDVLVIWECEIKRGLPLEQRIEKFLGKRGVEVR